MLETTDIQYLILVLEQFLFVWLLALICQWVLSLLFGEKKSRIIGFIGFASNYFVKRIILEKIFKVPVLRSDASERVFVHGETKRFDIIFCALFFFPFLLAYLFAGVIIGIALFLETMGFILIPIILKLMAFLISINAVPSLDDVKDLQKSSVRSIIVWLPVASLFSIILFLILYPFMDLLAAFVAIIASIIITTIITYFVPFISKKMVSDSEDSEGLIGGTVELDS
jgi:hypothetical protein